MKPLYLSLCHAHESQYCHYCSARRHRCHETFHFDGRLPCLWGTRSRHRSKSYVHLQSAECIAFLVRGRTDRCCRRGLAIWDVVLNCNEAVSGASFAFHLPRNCSSRPYQLTLGEILQVRSCSAIPCWDHALWRLVDPFHHCCSRSPACVDFTLVLGWPTHRS